jgi:hypothetical protein
MRRQWVPPKHYYFSATLHGVTSQNLYGMHPVVYSSLKGYGFETVYTTIS